MALSDGLTLQVYPVAGETAVKNIVNNTLFSGAGTPTLITDESIAAWAIATGTLLTNALAERTISGSAAGDGVTIALRFKLTANGTNSFMSLAGFKAAADTVDQNIRISRNGSSNYRGRVNSVLSPALTGLTNGTVVTLVYRVTFRDGELDTGEIWRNTAGRIGNDPDAVSAGANFGSIAFDRGFINCQTDAAYTLYDMALWGRELTNAECAAVADSYRAVMPAAGAPVATPIAFNGTIPAQSFTAGDSVDVDLAPYYSGNRPPFTFANTGTALTGTGLAITSAGRLQGTATEGAVTGVIVTGTDADANTADSNAFNVTVSAEPDPEPEPEPGTDPVFTSGILHDNNKQPLASVTLLHATLYDITTGALVVRVTNPTTTSTGRVVITSPLLTAGTDYDLNVQTADGQRIMPRGTAV